MNNAEDDYIDCKLGLDAENMLCRCCLAIEKPMLSATTFSQYFSDLAGIDVFASDGIPPWICQECSVLLHKAAKFKYKMLKVQTMLYEYITRCAPFPIDANDPEIAKYASPHLSSTVTLVFDLDSKKKMGFHKVLEHEKIPQKSELDSIVIPPVVDKALDQEAIDIKAESDLSDYEDDLPLQEFKSTIPADIKLDDEESPDIKLEVEVEIKKNKETKSRKRKKCVEEDEPKPKKSIRKPIEIDPAKIKIITLNPEEQFRQRQEESKAGLKFTFQCHLCYKGFNFESKLENHMKKHSPSRGPYECTICHMFLPNGYSYGIHSLIHTRRYECTACGRRMIDKASISHHYRTQHEGITTVITCELCGKLSSNVRTHRGHMRNHHSGERPKCDQCGKTFVNKDSLTDHMLIHDGIKNYECPTCGKRCRTRAQINTHLMMHSEDRPYYCVECDVRFKSAGSLKQHLVKSLKHKDVDTLTHACTMCSRRYDSAAALAQHRRIQHEGVRAHPCGTCGAALASRTSLHKHRAHVHRGLRPHSNNTCTTCNRHFTSKSVLVNHMRTHTGEKPFPCATCGRCFAQRTAMRTHMRRVHKIQVNTPISNVVEARPAPKVMGVQGPPWPRHREEELFYVTAGP